MRVIQASGSYQHTWPCSPLLLWGRSSVLSLRAFMHGFLPSGKHSIPGRLSSQKGESGEENLVVPSVPS